jgi:LPS export ABC transporter permease LptF
MPGLKLVDRYLLREMALPFILAVVGFLVFILLLLLGQFSNLLVNRVLDPGALALLLLYKTPYFLVWALPIATLFAVFLALGRLGHDREVIALQAAGISPRRLIAPLIVVGLLLSAVDFWMSNTLAPWGNREFLKLYLEQLYGGQRTPQIRDNAFFKGADERFFYVRRYDPDTSTLQDVLIYDFTGQLALDAENDRLPKVITARTAAWEGDVWRLQDGTLYAFDDEGRLRYSSRFEAMDIRVGGTIQKLVFEQRTPSEMSLQELAERIRAFRAIGRAPDALLVEYHLKMAIPLASLVFALFGAPLSLLIGPRGRALGVILSVLLVLLYQGVLFWTAQILGNRGDLPPAAGAWLPNALFGLIGLILFLRADRLGRLDLVERARRLLPLMLALGLTAGLALADEEIGRAQPPPRPSVPQGVSVQTTPFKLEAERLTIARDGRALEAQGRVRVSYADGTIEAQILRLSAASNAEPKGSVWQLEAEEVTFALEREGLRGQAGRLQAQLLEQDEIVLLQALTLVQSVSVELPGGQLSAERIALHREAAGTWTIEAQGHVRLHESEEKLSARAERLAVKLRLAPGAKGEWRAEAAQAEHFAGELEFTNPRGETHRLRYQGESAQLAFDEQSQVKSLTIARGEFTTCPCSEEIPQAAYSIRAERLYIWPEEWLAAWGITMRAFGTPIFWAPAYLAPLGDVRQRYPFLPELGRDARRGWFARWRLPFFAEEGLFGFLLLDVYTGSGEVGSGLDLNYQALPGSQGGRLSFYRLVGAEESLSLDWSERLQLDEQTRLNLALGLRTGLLAQQTTKLLSQAVLSGSEAGWNWRVGLSREQHLLGPEPDPETLKKLPYRVLERLPELTLSRELLDVGFGFSSLQLSLGLSFGRYQEVPLDGPTQGSARFDGRSQLILPALSLLPGVQFSADAGARLSLYERTRREAFDVSARLRWQPFPNLSASLAQLDRLVRGQSPFRFDQLAQEHRTTLQGQWRWGESSLQLSAGYDWQRGRFTPVRASFTSQWERLRLRTQLQLDLDLNALSLTRLTGQGALADWLSLSGGYDFQRARFDDLIIKLNLGEPLRAGLRFDPNALAPRRVSLQTQWALGDWTLDFGAEYDIPRERFTALQLGLVKSFCHACWQVGFYASEKRVWLEARINAFPAAEIRYSPTDQSLSFGS